MADISARDLERVQFAFSIFDFDGSGKIDGFYVPDLVRALNLNPTNAVMDKLGLVVGKGKKMVTMDEFKPVFATIKKDKDSGSYEDFVEVLKLYDKQENGTMMIAELDMVLSGLGECLDKDETAAIIAELCDPEDEDGFIPFEPFLKKLCDGVN